MLSLVRAETRSAAARSVAPAFRSRLEPHRPAPRPVRGRAAAPVIIPVTMVRVRRPASRELRIAVGVVRAAVLAGSLTAAWQLGMVLGRL